jgi:protein-tyrosine phosphatase
MASQSPSYDLSERAKVDLRPTEYLFSSPCGTYVMTESCQFASAVPDEEYVYGACAPGWDRRAGGTVEEWISLIQSRGIKRVLCLLSAEQLDRFDNLLAQYRQAFGDDRVAHVPVMDHTLIDKDTLRSEIIPVLTAAVEAEEPIVVHCLAGIGRTGQALAGWLVFQYGYDTTEAISTVISHGRQPDDAVRKGRATREELQTLLDGVE